MNGINICELSEAQAEVHHVYDVGGVQAHSAGSVFPCVVHIEHRFRKDHGNHESIVNRLIGATVVVTHPNRSTPVARVDYDPRGGFKALEAAHRTAYNWAHLYLIATDADNAPRSSLTTICSVIRELADSYVGYRAKSHIGWTE